MSRDLDKRLERLEAQATEELPAFWSPNSWTLDMQLEDLQNYVNFHQRFKTTAVCTDREINLLGLAAAYKELEGKPGAWLAPSGAVVHLALLEEGSRYVALSSNLAVEDLLPHHRECVERMDPARQAEREEFLYEYHKRGEG